jgi:CBS domain-containing protein
MSIARILAQRNAGEIVTCDAAMPLRDAVALLAEKRIGALPVMDGGRVAGIFSERDVIHCLASHGGGVLDLTVGHAMTAPAITVSPDTDVLAALALMTQRRIRHLPVTEAGELVGFISIGDLVKHRIDRIEAEAEAMRSYIQA